MKVKKESRKKTQIEVHLEIKKFKNLNRNIRDNLTNRIQEIEIRISGSEDTIKEMDTPVKENFQPKIIPL